MFLFHALAFDVFFSIDDAADGRILAIMSRRRRHLRVSYIHRYIYPASYYPSITTLVRGDGI